MAEGALVVGPRLGTVVAALQDLIRKAFRLFDSARRNCELVGIVSMVGDTPLEALVRKDLCPFDSACRN